MHKCRSRMNTWSKGLPKSINKQICNWWNSEQIILTDEFVEAAAVAVNAGIVGLVHPAVAPLSTLMVKVWELPTVTPVMAICAITFTRRVVLSNVPFATTASSSRNFTNLELENITSFGILLYYLIIKPLVIKKKVKSIK